MQNAEKKLELWSVTIRMRRAAHALHAVSALLDQIQNLIEFCCEQVKRGQNAPVRP
jgi:hypothetical protein